MNKDLSHLYEDLDPIRKKHLTEVFAKAPKMIRLIELLESNKNISTVKAVNTIYQEDLKQHSFQKLTNRFYKLRQELKEWLLTQLKDTPVCFTPEEQMLGYLRLLLSKNEFRYAMEKIIKLEEQCWKLNLFELLPAVLELRIRALQSIEYTNRELQEIYAEKYKLACQLFQVHKEIKMHYNSLVYINEKEKFEQIVQSIRRLIKPYGQEYPRLKKLYHVMMLSKGVFLPNPKFNILVRHLNAYKKLSKEHPLVPIFSYESNYKVRMDLDFMRTEAIFWIMKNEFKKAAKILDATAELKEQHPEIYHFYDERGLHNTFIIYLSAGDFEKCYYWLNELKTYVENNPSKQIIYPAQLNELEYYGFAFPKIKHPNPQDLLDAVYKIEQKNKKAAYILGIKNSKIRYYICLKKFVNARKLLQDPDVIAHYKRFNHIEDFVGLLLNFIEILEKNNKLETKMFIELIKEKKKKNRMVISPNLWPIYGWLERVAKYYNRQIY
ncbi:MAG: hypothetical protein MK212_11160 [Saprospiraceae bacterium]|nr:hypothetical protein [Saprospiraceae bacterium]